MCFSKFQRSWKTEDYFPEILLQLGFWTQFGSVMRCTGKKLEGKGDREHFTLAIVMPGKQASVMWIFFDGRLLLLASSVTSFGIAGQV